MILSLDILYCSTNAEADNVALRLVEECEGDVQARAMNLLDEPLQRHNREAVVLVYLNKYSFQDPNSFLRESIKRAITDGIQVLLVHENDPNQGGCEFAEIIKQTPTELMQKPYSIYSENLAVGLYSLGEYQKISLRQLLVKMGARPSGPQSVIHIVRVARAQLTNTFTALRNTFK